MDPRVRRIAAALDGILLGAAFVFGVLGNATSSVGSASFGWFAYQPLAKAVFFPNDRLLPTLSVAERAADTGFVLLAAAAVLLFWQAVSPRTHPGRLLADLAARRGKRQPSTADPSGARFAAWCAFAVVCAGLVLHLAGVPFALPACALAVAVAALVDAAFGVCLGCRLHTGLRRRRPDSGVATDDPAG